MAKITEYQALSYELIVRRGKQIRCKSEGNIVSDINILKGLLGKYPRRMSQLSVPSIDELDKTKVKKAKANYFNYCSIRNRRPEIVTDNVERIMDSLARAIAIWEGLMLYKLVYEIDDFHLKAFRDYLMNPCQMKRIDSNFIAHAADEYYMKARYIRKTQSVDDSCVTIFLDETSKPNPLSHSKDLISNYSYIIARGRLSKEAEINIGNIICEKVGQAVPTNHVEEVTCEGIGNALFTLLYEYNYTGNVVFKIDNLAAQVFWKRKKKKFAIYKCFKSVSLNHVNRRRNTKADALSRKYIAMTLSRKDYERLGSLKQIPFPAAAQANYIDNSMEMDSNLITFFRNPFGKRKAT